MVGVVTLETITKAQLFLLKIPIIPRFIRRLLAYDPSRNDMMSRVDHILDRHIDDVEKGDSIEDMLVEAAKEFAQPSKFEQIVPVRNTEFLEIEYKDYLLIPHKLLFDINGNLVSSPENLPEREYSKELTFNTQNKTHIGALTAYGEKISGYDDGFVNSFAEKLNTAILGFNRRKSHLEEKAMLLALNNIMGNDSMSIEERRQLALDEITGRIKAREGYMVILKDGKKPTIDTITEDDLEVKEYCSNGNMPGCSELSDEKKQYLLEKAVHVIKTPEEVDVFDDAKEKLGYCLATELKINETGKIGGAFVLLDDNEFLHSRQTMAEAAGLKIDDYVILNNELRGERALRMRMGNLFTRMFGKAKADYILDQHDLSSLSKPQLRKVIIMLTDMKGSTKIADELSKEWECLGSDDPTLQKKIDRYVEAINHYLEPGSESALRFRGALDKYIGDCVMDVWGVPIESHDLKEMARSAILAAVYANILTIKYNQRVDRERIKDDSVIKLEQRFILHCGKALAGIYGTELNWCYTIMGACVNEANRIEGLEVAETGKITMSHQFYSLIDDIVEAECVGEFQLKGKADSIKIYHFKSFRMDKGSFKAFAEQHVNPDMYDVFKRNTFFRDFMEGEYLLDIYLKKWALPPADEGYPE